VRDCIFELWTFDYIPKDNLAYQHLLSTLKAMGLLGANIDV